VFREEDYSPEGVAQRYADYASTSTEVRPSLPVLSLK
jgi:hypothetical protein